MSLPARYEDVWDDEVMSFAQFQKEQKWLNEEWLTEELEDFEKQMEQNLEHSV